MSEERKNCFVESFEALCDKGDFVLANKVKYFNEEIKEMVSLNLTKKAEKDG